MRKAAALVIMSLSGASMHACGSPQTCPPCTAATQAANSVPAGTRVTVHLNSALGTLVSKPGQHFTASVATPLVDANGQTVVPSGALVTGRVVGVDQGSTASIRILFTSIDAGQGPAPVSATVQSMARASSRFSAVAICTQGLPYSAVLLPPHPSPLGVGGRPAIGGGPRRPNPQPDPRRPGRCPESAPGPASHSSRESSVSLPVGTALELVLTQPLVYPPS